MNRKKILAALGIFALLVGYSILLSNILAAPVTITGTVNTNYQIVAGDGTAYKVADSEKAYELLALVGEKLEVTGVLEDIEGERGINVSSYKVLKD